MKSSIRALAELILENIDVLEADCAGRDVEVPSLQEPFKPGTGFAMDKPEVRRATFVVVAAAQQLVQTVRPPQVNLLTTAYEVSCPVLYTIINIYFRERPAHTRWRIACRRGVPHR